MPDTPQIENLSALEIEARKIDAELNNQTEQAQQEEKAPSINAAYKPAIMKALNTCVGFGDRLIPFTSQFYTLPDRENIADSIIEVADVEQFDLKSVFGETNSRIGAWVALAIALGAPTFGFYFALKAYSAEQNNRDNEKEVKGDIVPPGTPSADDLKAGFHA